MASIYFIYPVVISDEHFSRLVKEIDVLQKTNFDLISDVKVNHKSMAIILAQAILDIEEVVTNKNTKGYRYNSYLLNMVNLKITFCIETLRAKHDEKFTILIYNLETCINVNQTILLESEELNLG